MLAVTSQLIEGKIDKNNYLKQVLEIKKEYSRINSTFQGKEDNDEFTVKTKVKFNSIVCEPRWIYKVGSFYVEVLEFVR